MTVVELTALLGGVGCCIVNMNHDAGYGLQQTFPFANIIVKQ